MIYQGDVQKYIFETPFILKNIINERETIFSVCCKFLQNKKIKNLYLTGSGSSYNSAWIAAKFLRKILGIQVFTVYPVDFMEMSELIDSDSVIIGISQQGTSVAVIEALDKMRQMGKVTISVTGEYESEITRHSDANIYIECGIEDAGATTKGYTACILTLMLFGLQLSKCKKTLSYEDYVQYLNRINKVVCNMYSILEQSSKWCENITDHMQYCSNLVILAGGNQKLLLPEVVLKFSETCRIPVRGYPAEEFMHGMYNAVDEKTEFLYLFPTGGYELKRMQKLYHYYKNKGNKQYFLNLKAEDDLSCQFINDEDFSALEFILPLQILFVVTSQKKGIDLNVPKDPDFHKYMKSKIEE